MEQADADRRGGSDEGAGTQDPGDEEAGMDAVASSNATAIAGDRSGEGPLVILVGGAFQRRAIEAATAQLAGHVIVVRDDRRGRGDRAPSAAC